MEIKQGLIPYIFTLLVVFAAGAMAGSVHYEQALRDDDRRASLAELAAKDAKIQTDYHLSAARDDRDKLRECLQRYTSKGSKK